MTEPDTVTITLGIPGESDRVLAELRGVALQLGLTLSEAVALCIGYGMGVMRELGMTSGRVLEPLSRAELLRQLQEALEEAEG